MNVIINKKMNSKNKVFIYNNQLFKKLLKFKNCTKDKN